MDRRAQLPFKFDGSDYVGEFDNARLTAQLLRIWRLMNDGNWRTLSEIEKATGDPPASISAQLRHLRKERFGAHTIKKRARGNRAIGLFEYQLIVNSGGNNDDLEVSVKNSE